MEGHFLPAMHYLVRGVSITCLTDHVEIPIVQQRALLLVRVCACSGRGPRSRSAAVSGVPPDVPEACKGIKLLSTCNDKYVDWILQPSKDIVQLYKTCTTWHGLYLLYHT